MIAARKKLQEDSLKPEFSFSWQFLFQLNQCFTNCRNSEMKSVSSSEHLLAKINHSYAVNNGFPVIPFRLTSFGFYVAPPRFSVSSKKSSYQGQCKFSDTGFVFTV
ncbi:hypothetical protein KSS87_023603 [Heliosperma pusillum]|nr:hypothetical protein KSS87_023603 [Heliosperma pusillum]